MSDPTNRPTLASGIYTQPYNEIVKPGQIWRVSKYFLRRWTANLPSPSYVWLVIGARQESYLNHRRPWFTVYDHVLARAAGFHPDTYRRTAKQEIAAEEGGIAYFIQKVGQPGYQKGQATPKLEETRYTIRLDDPLIPADAQALAHWLRQNAPPAVTAKSLKALLESALKQRARQLRAESPAPVPPEAQGLLSVADVVKHVFPFLAGQKEWYEAADKLHSHIVEPHLDHQESHYFWRRWLPDLGPGPALLAVYLRSLCYHNEEEDEIRDLASVDNGRLAELFQVSGKTLGRWFGKLKKAVDADNPSGPFLRRLSSQKMSNQQVQVTYQVNLKTPLTAEDLPRYRQLLAGRAALDAIQTGSDAADRAEEIGVADKKSVTRQEGGGQKIGHATEGDGHNLGHAGGGSGTEDRSPGRGPGQKIEASGTKDRSFKYYKHLLDALNLPDFGHLLEKTKEQQHYWLLEGNQACLTFAAAALGSWEGLFAYFDIQGSTREKIQRSGLTLEEVVAWYLYALCEGGLQEPARYMMKQAGRRARPPEDFLSLARLSWELWRTYAAFWQLQPWVAEEKQAPFARLPGFALWRDHYARLELHRLPFEVGEGVDLLPELLTAAVQEEKEEEPGPHPAEVPGLAASDAERVHWQAALTELELQMTRATFNSWLRDTRLLGRGEDGCYLVGVRSCYARDWLQNRLFETISRTLSTVVGEAAEIQFIVFEE